MFSTRRSFPPSLGYFSHLSHHSCVFSHAIEKDFFAETEAMVDHGRAWHPMYESAGEGQFGRGREGKGTGPNDKIVGDRKTTKDRRGGKIT
nr:hypothetical protein CFP56_11363 [Quercus suber]